MHLIRDMLLRLFFVDGVGDGGPYKIHKVVSSPWLHIEPFNSDTCLFLNVLDGYKFDGKVVMSYAFCLGRNYKKETSAAIRLIREYRVGYKRLETRKSLPWIRLEEL